MKRIVLLCVVGIVVSLALTGCKKGQPPTVGQTVAGRFEAVDDQIEDEIDDKGKREFLLLLQEENRLAFQRIEAHFVKTAADTRKDPNIPREEIESALKIFGDFRVGQLIIIAKNRLKMRTLVTEDQWNRIFVPQPTRKEKKAAESKAEETDTERNEGEAS